MTKFRLKLGDCLEVMKDIPDNSFHSIVTDPPAGIAFMGKDWDKNKGGRSQWVAWMTKVAAECLRVLKPGGHALVWALPRTSHWTATAWEDAGFELRDKIFFLFGSGFPKNMDISKQLDKAAGAEREVIGVKPGHEGFAGRGNMSSVQSLKGTLGGEGGFSRPWMDDPEKVEAYHKLTAPATPAAIQWDGWGTALKPSVEEWILFRKPLSEKNIAENVLKWGVGGIHIDACRIPLENGVNLARNNKPGDNGWKNSSGGPNNAALYGTSGRFPSHLILDEEAARLLDEQTGNLGKSQGGRSGHTAAYSGGYKQEFYGDEKPGFGDFGGASRFFKNIPIEQDEEINSFFYGSKASKRDRDEGLEGMPLRKVGTMNDYVHPSKGRTADKNGGPKANHHPTVKPTSLMRYLCRLITPSNGIVFDPFMGSGSTGKAAILENFRFYGIEKEEDYLKIAEKRIEHALTKISR